MQYAHALVLVSALALSAGGDGRSSVGETAAKATTRDGDVATAELMIGEVPVPIPPPDFLKRPITGVKRVLFYHVAYPGGPGLPSVNNHNGTIGMEQFLAELRENLEVNSMDTLDVQVTYAQVLMPSGIGTYDTGCLDNMVRVLQDLRVAALAQQPAGKDWDWSNYDYEVVLTASFWTNGPQGGGGFNKNFRVSFLGGGSPNMLGLVVHEMGHGFKFEHASYWNGDPHDFTPPVTANIVQYGDEFDPMGQITNPQNNPIRHYNPRHKLWAGWIPSNRVPVVKSNGTYTIKKIENLGPGGLRGIRIRRDAQWTYHLFYRGEDAYAANLCYGDTRCNGAILTRSRESNLRPTGNTQLLNGNPLALAPEWSNAILPEGESFYDADAGILITVVDVLADRIQVEVTFDQSPQPAIDRLPVIDIRTPKAGKVLTGTKTIRVSAYDPDVGTENFDGIQKIVIGIPSPLHNGTCVSGEYEHCTTLTSPGQNWVFDTALLCDGPNEFVVEAHSIAPVAVRRIRFRFLTDNGVVCCPGGGGDTDF